VELSFVQDLLVLLLLATAVTLACHRVGLPAVVGLLVTGVIAGPHGLALFRETDDVERLAEVGVILLLFTIGIEFSLDKLRRSWKAVLAAGPLQVVFTAGAGFLGGMWLGAGTAEGIVLGFLLSMSSTAVVFRLLQGRRQLDSVHGRTTAGVLLFQDLAFVPMMLVVPLLAQGERAGTEHPVASLVLGLAVLAASLVGARWVVPRLLHAVARTRDREPFLLAVIAIGLLVAWLTSLAGLSLALGAFLAGLLLSDSEYGHQALGDLLPFRDLFSSFFFVSIGMLLDLEAISARPVGLLAATVGVVAVKAVLAGAAAAWIGLSWRSAVLVGLALAQIGEFSFVLAESAESAGLLSPGRFDAILAVSVLTMAVTPLVIALSPRVADLVSAWPFFRSKPRAAADAVDEAAAPSGHVVIVGFGLNGRNLALAARRAGIRYVVLEANADTARREKANGEPITFGDATQANVLEHAHVASARVVVVAVSDLEGTRRIVRAVRRLAPAVWLIVRTRYVQEMRPLREQGADEVIPEEFETSVEIFTRVLRAYLVCEDSIHLLTEEVRAGGYEMLLAPYRPPGGSHVFPNAEIRTLRVEAGSRIAGLTLAEAELRPRHAVTVLAVGRGEEIRPNPDPGQHLEPDDELVLFGGPAALARVAELFRRE